jgi:hypothetical protein
MALAADPWRDANIVPTTGDWQASLGAAQAILDDCHPEEPY